MNYNIGKKIMIRKRNWLNKKILLMTSIIFLCTLFVLGRYLSNVTVTSNEDKKMSVLRLYMS